tara:strand:+ start:1495 stop:2052 length:558 start_codon:yes stop_codon:yes gene_type:complete
MTVRVSKPEFNLREKISELDFGQVPLQKMPAGSVVQVVFGSTTTEAMRAHSTNNGTETFVFDTNLSATITPRFTTSKILVQINQSYMFINTTSTQMQANVLICDGDNNVLDGRSLNYDMLRVKNITAFAGTHSAQLLHSPNTISTFTYKTRGNFYHCEGGTGYLAFQYANKTNCVSTISLMEIAQ